MIKAAIFDLDGTLIDSNSLDFDAWQRILRENGASLSWDDYLQIVGATSAEIFKQYLNLEDEQKMKELVSQREAYFREVVTRKGLKLLPGVEEMLKSLQAIPLRLALATGSNQEKLDFVFHQVNIQSYFEVIVQADEVTHGKPHPEVFLKAAEKLKLSPAECVVLEDAKKGVEAAKAGGMRCIAINTNRQAQLLTGADLLLETYEKLALSQWLERNQEKAT